MYLLYYSSHFEIYRHVPTALLITFQDIWARKCCTLVAFRNIWTRICCTFHHISKYMDTHLLHFSSHFDIFSSYFVIQRHVHTALLITFQDVKYRSCSRRCFLCSKADHVHENVYRRRRFTIHAHIFGILFSRLQHITNVFNVIRSQWRAMRATARYLFIFLFFFFYCFSISFVYFFFISISLSIHARFPLVVTRSSTAHLATGDGVMNTQLSAKLDMTFD